VPATSSLSLNPPPSVSNASCSAEFTSGASTATASSAAATSATASISTATAVAATGDVARDFSDLTGLDDSALISTDESPDPSTLDPLSTDTGSHSGDGGSQRGSGDGSGVAVDGVAGAAGSAEPVQQQQENQQVAASAAATAAAAAAAPISAAAEPADSSASHNPKPSPHQGSSCTAAPKPPPAAAPQAAAAAAAAVGDEGAGSSLPTLASPQQSTGALSVGRAEPSSDASSHLRRSRLHGLVVRRRRELEGLGVHDPLLYSSREDGSSGGGAADLSSLVGSLSGGGAGFGGGRGGAEGEDEGEGDMFVTGRGRFGDDGSFEEVEEEESDFRSVSVSMSGSVLLDSTVTTPTNTSRSIG